jgi:hypothetical protein
MVGECQAGRADVASPQEQLGQARVLVEPSAQGACEAAELAFPVAVAADDPREVLLGDRSRGEIEERLLVGHVPVERHPRRAHLGGEIADRERLDAVAPGDRERALDDLLAGEAAPWAAGRGHGRSVSCGHCPQDVRVP